jgi:Tfp pilus assembly protein PilV
LTILTKWKKDKGFSILEALIAFFVISLGALAIAGLLSRSLEMNADGEARTEALHLAKMTIADFRNFTSKAEVKAYITDATGNTVTGDHAVFTRTWTVADVSGNSNAILLTVDVAWTGVNGAQSISLASEIAKLKPERAGTYLLAESVITPVVSTTSTSTTTATSTITLPTISTSSTSTTTNTTITTSTTTTTLGPILYTCTCTWAETPSGKCTVPASSVDSDPLGGACCTLSACNGYVPSDSKACKKKTGLTTFTCAGDPLY